MTREAQAAGGFVDKFIGDAVLVVFGLFGPDDAAAPRDGRRGGAALRRRHARRGGGAERARAASGQAPVALKIGVHTGPVVAGTIGAAERHEYTVIGDTVNVAARLEQLCRDQGRDLLVSAETHRLASEAGPVAAPTLREAVTLRGREDPVEVLGLG